MKALVVNCARNGLGVIRSLGKMGAYIIAVDHKRFTPAFYSKYVARRHVVENVVCNTSGFVDDILSIAVKEALDDKIFLLPMNDEYLLTFARHWEQLQGGFYPVFETDMEILLNCLEKTRMYRIAEDAGIPHPQTVYSPHEAKECLALNFPVVVKVRNRRETATMEKGDFRTRICHTSAQLEETIGQLHGLGIDFLAQRYIPGADDQLYTTGLLAYKGDVVAAFTGRKLRQFPPVVGECSYGELVNEPKIIDYATRFVKAADYTGIAQVEFKQHEGEFYLMEINARSWSWNSLAEFSGVNLPWIACQTVKSGNTHPVKQERFKGTWSYFDADMWYNVIGNRNVSVLTALSQAFRADRHAYWDAADPLPALVQIACRMARAARALVARGKTKPGRRARP